MKQTKNTGFTLVELIVVITILAILSTVAFISFQGYTSSSRDAVRLSDLKNITKAFEMQKTKEVLLPLPQDRVDITSSGSIFQYQWTLSSDMLKAVWVHNGWFDPSTKLPYWYVVNEQRDRFQLIWFLENAQTLWYNLFQTSFADNSDKYMKLVWEKMWVFLDNQNNNLITSQSWTGTVSLEWDLTGYNIFIDETNKIQADKISVLKNTDLKIYSSCRELLATHSELQNKDDYYVLMINGQADAYYCDMTRDGWWWTLYSGKNMYHLDNKWYLFYNTDFLESTTYSQIRYNYVTPSWTYFPLIYTPYSQREGNLILEYHSYVDRAKWDATDQNYPDNIAFQNAFSIWEWNTSTLTIENIRTTIANGWKTKMMWRPDPRNEGYHLVMWTAFQWWWANYSQYLRFPAQPYVGTYRVGDETFGHREISQEWDDGRSITIWVK